MFEKQIEKIKNRKIKEHFEDNKDLYTGIVIGGVAVWIFKSSVGSTQISNTAAPVFNNMPNISPVFNNVVNNGGHMRKIVRCVETDEMWSSVSKAAEAAGSSIAKMSRHLNGHVDHVNELHYVIEGLAAG